MNKKFHIRRARHEDANGIIRSHKESIVEFCSKDYTREQIIAWSERPSREAILKGAIDRDFIWVVVSEDEKVHGFGHLAIMDEINAEVLGLYFTPQIKGLGLGKKMWNIFLEVLGEKEVSRISLFSTLTSKPFYEKLGFYQYSGDSSIKMQDVDIPCIPMEVILKK